ncbi:sugar ABC transporter permease [bacteria symbiont BFo1 of Frankliniella occidentalis]|jgi:simple sugar transport system permease protein|uniref:ABC transporter permease n=1 Tax=Erwinia aphidicola TaxID=68334 RepID=A0ABU8DGV2_ERWAP|nr:ABC transporter permease [Erwinia aphidicola]KMV71586.1 sugar ABC transporter permease [bacteria symbiont BFo1 of Frankliniella occidentalis]PIJ60180.1 sugar ABC transporter permease [Erwinia sp. OLMDLW33]KYP85475.1 sugar ABC transporter permease [bacteria symbiont BFo1 of Frankliniella occidentalis]KYP90869.1 sugar ABC transporter permease [bacteria symbiont BFo1 of Frankliniella occidentalis]MBD1375735.1 ABC transporter permease [Erwinia aphidicola]
MNSKLRHLISHHEFWLGLLIVLLALGLSLRTSEFLTLGNLTDVATSYAILGILACGLFVVLIAGGIDISFPAMTAIAQYVMASTLLAHGGNFFSAFAIAIGCGLLLGMVNGLLVYLLRVPAIIITIATLNLFYGLLVWITNGTWLYGFPEWFMNGINWLSFTASDGYEYGLTLPLLCLLGVFVLTGVLMNFTRFGRQIYAMGGNRESASRLGINLRSLHLAVYGYMGVLAGVAAVVQAQTTQSVAPNSLVGYELTVLAAVVLGGASMSGGRGTLIGTLLGVLLLAFLQNGLTLMAVSSYWHMVFSGVIILVSVSATAWNEKHQLAKGN